jgi:hypothetical protein
MEIRRGLSGGATWAIAMSQVPPLLELIDEQRIPVDICLTQGTGSVTLRAESVFCRRCLRSLMLEGSGNSVRVDLDQLEEALAVSRSTGKQRRISLQLIARSSTASLMITGPTPGQGLAGQVWHLVMESLLPENRGVSAPRTVTASSPPDPDGTRAPQLLYPAGSRSWNRSATRMDFAQGRRAVGAKG